MGSALIMFVDVETANISCVAYLTPWKK